MTNGEGKDAGFHFISVSHRNPQTVPHRPFDEEALGFRDLFAVILIGKGLAHDLLIGAQVLMVGLPTNQSPRTTGLHINLNFYPEFGFYYQANFLSESQDWLGLSPRDGCRANKADPVAILICRDGEGIPLEYTQFFSKTT